MKDGGKNLNETVVDRGDCKVIKLIKLHLWSSDIPNYKGKLFT